MAKRWGLRSATFESTIEGKFLKPRNKDIKLVVSTRDPDFKDILFGILALLGKFYLVTILVYFVWNFTLVAKAGLKPVSGLDAIILTLLINYVRTPRDSAATTIANLMQEKTHG